MVTSILDVVCCWNATDEERQAVYPCDRYIDAEYREMLRAIDIKAPVSVVFRWICQLKVAPYSYDWITWWVGGVGWWGSGQDN